MKRSHSLAITLIVLFMSFSGNLYSKKAWGIIDFNSLIDTSEIIVECTPVLINCDTLLWDNCKAVLMPQKVIWGIDYKDSIYVKWDYEDPFRIYHMNETYLVFLVKDNYGNYTLNSWVPRFFMIERMGVWTTRWKDKIHFIEPDGFIHCISDEWFEPQTYYLPSKLTITFFDTPIYKVFKFKWKYAPYKWFKDYIIKRKSEQKLKQQKTNGS